MLRCSFTSPPHSEPHRSAAAYWLHCPFSPAGTTSRCNARSDWSAAAPRGLACIPRPQPGDWAAFGRAGGANGAACRGWSGGAKGGGTKHKLEVGGRGGALTLSLQSRARSSRCSRRCLSHTDPAAPHRAPAPRRPAAIMVKIAKVRPAEGGAQAPSPGSGGPEAEPSRPHPGEGRAAARPPSGGGAGGRFLVPTPGSRRGAGF